MIETELAWAAGFFDGEGYISIVARNQKDKYHHQYVRLGINHVDPRPLQKFQQLFGGKLNSAQGKGNRHTRWQWKLTCQQAKDFILALRPYLINKDIVADIALEFLDTIGNTGERLTPEVLSTRVACAARLKLVNSET